MHYYNTLKASLYFSITLFTLSNPNPLRGEGTDTDVYGGYKSIQGTRTGFFHIEQIEERPWLVTPEGHGMLGLSMSHPFTSESIGACQEIHNGDQDAWIRATVKKMRDLGFNCMLSPPTTPDRIKHGGIDSELVHKIVLEEKMPHAIGLILAKHSVELKEGEQWPDIFSKEYEKFVWKEAERLARKYANEPFVIGYFYGYGTFILSVDWVNDLLGADPSSAGRIHLSAILKNRYNGRLAAFNKIYNTKFKSLPEITTGTLPPYPNQMRLHAIKKFNTANDIAMAADFNALMTEMARHLYQTAYQAIRTYDRNHLILGGSVKENDFSDSMWQAIAPYIDVIAPQHILKRVDINQQAKLVGKPILLSDAVLGLVPRKHPVPEPYRKWFMATKTGRNRMYQKTIERVSHDKNIIGVNLCMTMYDHVSGNWHALSEPGLYQVDGTPKSEYIDTVKQTNAKIFSWLNNSIPHEAFTKLHKDFLNTYQETYDSHGKE